MNILQILEARRILIFHPCSKTTGNSIDAHSWGVVAIATYLCQGRSRQHVLDVIMAAMFDKMRETIGILPSDDFTSWIVRAATSLEIMNTLMHKKSAGDTHSDLDFLDHATTIRSVIGYDEATGEYDTETWLFHHQAVFDMYTDMLTIYRKIK